MENEYPVADFTVRELNEVVKRLGGREAVKFGLDRKLGFLLQRGALHAVIKNRVQTTYATLPPTDGTTGSQWVHRLGRNDFFISEKTFDLLNSPHFIATKGIVYSVAILSGVFSSLKSAEAEANERCFGRAHAELACMLRESFSDWQIGDMGFNRIIAMHTPIKNEYGHPCLLSVQTGVKRLLSHVIEGDNTERLNRTVGLAFVRRTSLEP